MFLGSSSTQKISVLLPEAARHLSGPGRCRDASLSSCKPPLLLCINARTAQTFASLPASLEHGVVCLLWVSLDGQSSEMGSTLGPLPRKCGHQHPPLVGRDSTGAFRTAPTAAYGPGLCKALAVLALKTTASSQSRKGGEIATDEAVLASASSSPLNDAEELAKNLLDKGTAPTKEQLLQVFELLPGETPSRGQAEEDSKSFIVGSYSVGGGLAGIRRNTRSFPSVARLLCGFVKSLAEDFLFSCVGLFRNLRTRPHKDSGNQKGTMNLVTALEPFVDGGIWVQSDRGTHSCPFEEVADKGTLLSLETGHVVFDSRKLHCTQSWKGRRTVLVAFTSHLGPALSLEDRNWLGGLGFNLKESGIEQEEPMWDTPSRKRLPDPATSSGGAEDDDNPDAPPGWWQWTSGPDSEDEEDSGSTSEEDEDGHIKPKRGDGVLGYGAPLVSVLAGKVRTFSDGHGLASPGRWPPHARPCAELDSRLHFHKEFMDELLKLIGERVDARKVACLLATGKCKSCPFPEGLILAGRDLLFAKLRTWGSQEPLEQVPERQPFFLYAISEMLRLADDPDWRQYTVATHSYAAGVPLGVDYRMPRNPALFGRKLKHRDYTGLGGDPGDSWRENYSSVEPYVEQVEKQFEDEIRLGSMIKLEPEEAVRRFGPKLSVASLGAVPKPDKSVRVVFAATHGQHINDSIRVRDQQSYPTGADLKASLESLPFATFSLSGDVSRAHRLIRVREADWPRQSCRARKGGSIFTNTVGTFGVASASYWWFRMMAGLGRLLYYAHGKDETTLLSYVDDLLWLTQSADGLLRIVASILLLTILGMPFAWHKFSGGREHDWIGFALCVPSRTIGISLSRSDWIVNWIRKVRADGMVRISDLKSVLGRLSFAFSVIPLLRPFLGPIYAWTSATQALHTLRLPKAIELILSFLQTCLEQGMRRVTIGRQLGPVAEMFRTDARAQGSELWIGGWCCADNADPRKCRWFSEKIDHLKFPIFYMAGQSYRSISALELLATLVAVILFKPDGKMSGVNICSASTDNRGNSFVTARWLTTAFPLNAVLMELAAVLQKSSLALELHWAPRLQNKLADALSNGVHAAFDPRLRLRFNFESYRSLVLHDLMDLGSELYGEIKEHKAKLVSRRAAKLRKGERLRDNDPWK